MTKSKAKPAAKGKAGGTALGLNKRTAAKAAASG
jgi:hypothetical protein